VWHRTAGKQVLTWPEHCRSRSPYPQIFEINTNAKRARKDFMNLDRAQIDFRP
jgi:hypothetical protein